VKRGLYGSVGEGLGKASRNGQGERRIVINDGSRISAGCLARERGCPEKLKVGKKKYAAPQKEKTS